jgi:mannose-6-phosphate isomerase-like protein (cupin superfamily)
MHRKQGKIWGHTNEIFDANNVEIHRISTVKGTKCSRHKHISKWNKFFVESGKLAIDIWKPYGLVDRTILGPGEFCDVEPGLVHRFLVLEDTIAYEIYWVSLDANDIVREDSGGLMKPDDYRCQKPKKRTQK